jgi:hypothetical protein
MSLILQIWFLLTKTCYGDLIAKRFLYTEKKEWLVYRLVSSLDSITSEVHWMTQIIPHKTALYKPPSALRLSNFKCCFTGPLKDSFSISHDLWVYLTYSHRSPATSVNSECKEMQGVAESRLADAKKSPLVVSSSTSSFFLNAFYHNHMSFYVQFS